MAWRASTTAMFRAVAPFHPTAPGSRTAPPQTQRAATPIRERRSGSLSLFRIYNPLRSNHRNSSTAPDASGTMTTQWFTPSTCGRVILPKSPQVSRVAFMTG